MIKELNKTTKLIGKSGKEYTFELYSYDDFQDLIDEIDVHRPAIYLFTNRHLKLQKKFVHTNIYLGETGDIATRYSGHHKEKCIRAHNANCIGFWWAPEDEDERKEAEKDLLDANNFPCNEINN